MEKDAKHTKICLIGYIQHCIKSDMKSLSIFALSLLLFSTLLQAEEAESPSFKARLYDYWVNGASITLGVGVRETGATITRLSDGASGKLVQRNEEAYFLSYKTRPRYFDNSNFGYSWMLNLSSFDMQQQEVAKEQYQDLGTRISGAFAYVVPTFFYNWGNNYKDNFVRAGIGLGLGLAVLSGDIILTDSAIPNDRVILTHDSTKLKLAASFMIEARRHNWGVRIGVAGPTLEEAGYTISVTDMSVNLGYSFFF